MSSLKAKSAVQDFRERFKISQQDMADYLKITRSLLSMVETGDRELPTEAMLRLGALDSLYHNTSDSKRSGYFIPDVEMQKKEAVAAEALKARCKKCRKLAEEMQIKLDDMEQDYKNILRWQHIIEEMLNNMPNSRQGEGDRLWLEIQLGKIPEKVTMCTPAIQAKLQAEIELLQAEAEIKERLQQKLAGGVDGRGC